MLSTPLPPSNADIPATPSTSPQHYQQAAHNQERNQRLIGSPEQHRTPADPSHPPALPSVIVGRRELTHLPFDMCMRMIDIPPHQPLPQRHGHAPLWPCPSMAISHPSSSSSPSLSPSPSPSSCFCCWLWLCGFCSWFWLCSYPSPSSPFSPSCLFFTTDYEYCSIKSSICIPSSSSA